MQSQSEERFDSDGIKTSGSFLSVTAARRPALRHETRRQRTPTLKITTPGRAVRRWAANPHSPVQLWRRRPFFGLVVQRQDTALARRECRFKSGRVHQFFDSGDVAQLAQHLPCTQAFCGFDSRRLHHLRASARHWDGRRARGARAPAADTAPPGILRPC